MASPLGIPSADWGAAGAGAVGLSTLAGAFPYPTSASGTQTTTPSWTPGQTSLQQQLESVLQGMLGTAATGGKSPNVVAMEGQSADQINQNFTGLSDRMTKFLSSRGFGKSGLVGNDQVKVETARQGALANNSANYSSIQNDQNMTALQDALGTAFASPGSTVTSSQKTSSGGGIGGAAAGAASGFAAALPYLMMASA